MFIINRENLNKTTFSSFQCFKNCAISVATCSLGLSIFVVVVVVVVVVGELPTHTFFNRPVSVIQILRCLCSKVGKIYAYSLGVKFKFKRKLLLPLPPI